MTPTREVLHHIGQTLRIGAPVVVSRAGFIGLVVVDTVMSGRAGTDELAYFSIASGPQLFLMMVGIGLLRGAPVLTAQAYGAGEDREIGALWRVIALHAFALSLVLMAISLAGEPLLRLLGQSPDLARGGGEVMRAFAWSLPFYMVWVSLVNLLEGMGRTIPAMVITGLSVAANAGANWILVFGNLGAPTLGAEGAQLGTTIVRAVMLLVFAVYVLQRPEFRRFALIGSVRDVWARGKTLRRLGYPMGLATGVEALAYALMTILAGLLGKESLAAFQTANSLVSLVFMVAIGIGAGTAVRVAQAVGRGDRRAAIYAAWTGTGLGTGALALAALVFFLAPATLAHLYVEETEIVALAEPVFYAAGAVLAFHGAQTVLMGALRGVGDVWYPTGVQFIGGWILMLPVGAVLAFALDRGASGLMVGLLCSVVFATAVLARRFRKVSQGQFARL